MVGTRLDKKGVDSDHVWVMTRDGVNSGTGAAVVTFWESLTGQRVPPTATTPSGHRFLRVCMCGCGCVAYPRASLRSWMMACC